MGFGQLILRLTFNYILSFEVKCIPLKNFIHIALSLSSNYITPILLKINKL